MKGKSKDKNIVENPVERERIKRIMSKPVNPRCTELYWMSLGRFKTV